MKLHGELAVCLFQVIRTRILGHTQRGVIILLGHISPSYRGAFLVRPQNQLSSY
jgi:hypothetical protein